MDTTLYAVTGALAAVAILVGLMARWSRKMEHAKELLLQLVSEDWISGQILRVRLADLGIGLSGPTFYKIMADLGKDIDSMDERAMIDGQVVFERMYRRHNDKNGIR